MHRQGGLNEGNVFLTVLEAKGLGSGRQQGQVVVRPCPGPQTVGILARRGKSRLLTLLIRALIPRWGPHPHDLQRPNPSGTTRGFRASTFGIWGDTNIQSTATTVMQHHFYVDLPHTHTDFYSHIGSMLLVFSLK